MPAFDLTAPYSPKGDQPTAITQLVDGVNGGERYQTLLGATGTGKTFTMANVIAQTGRPALVLAHNKTLAAQLCNELREFFPENAVEYFISYYDYYQPEAYVPVSDTYIAKTASINEEIDMLRHSATRSLFERRDVIVVASISCIYGLGIPSEYLKAAVKFEVGATLNIRGQLRELVNNQYSRNDTEIARGRFRMKGDVLEIGPAYDDRLVRIELFGDEVEAIRYVDPTTGEILQSLEEVNIYPAKHFVTPKDRLDDAIKAIRTELRDRLEFLNGEGKLLEAQRLEQRTKYDLEMLDQVGYCNGVENYARHLAGREAGTPPECLIDYFPDDWLLIVDESHVTCSQLQAMYNGDQARKKVLIDHGFRLPSAADNRPLKSEEFWSKAKQTVFVSATPGNWEMEISEGQIAEQVIRPTGVLDPIVEVRPTTGQVDDLLGEIRDRASKNQRVLVTTLTKRMTEDLPYRHQESPQAKPRADLILPATNSLQRAARHVEGKALLYAENMTESMAKAIEETERRRAIQHAYNEKHGITPTPAGKKATNSILSFLELSRKLKADGPDADLVKVAGKAVQALEEDSAGLALDALPELIDQLELKMKESAKKLDFEEAANLRDRVKQLRQKMAGSR